MRGARKLAVFSKSVTTTDGACGRMPNRVSADCGKATAQYKIAVGAVSCNRAKACEQCRATRLDLHQRYPNSKQQSKLTLNGTSNRNQGHSSIAERHDMQPSNKGLQGKHTNNMLCSFAALLALATPPGLLPSAGLVIMRTLTCSDKEFQ